MYSLEPVVGRRGLDEFVALPRQIYPRGSPWVGPFDFEVRAALGPRNPLSQGGYIEPFLLRDGGGQVVARVTLEGNPRFDAHYGKSTAFFGYFEVLSEVAAQAAPYLLEGLIHRAGERGAQRLVGPANLTPMETMGLLLNGFEERNCADAVYTHPIYPQLLETAAFRVALRARTYRIDDLTAIPVGSLSVDPRPLGSERIRLRGLNRRAADRDLEALRLLINAAFDRSSTNPYFVPLTAEEYSFQIRALRPVLVPDLVRFVEIDGRIQGGLLVIPDFNQVAHPLRGQLLTPRLLEAGIRWLRLQTATLVLIAVHPEAQGRGLGRALVADGLRVLLQRGYRRLGITWVAEDNAASAALWTGLGARSVHTVGTYELDL